MAALFLAPLPTKAAAPKGPVKKEKPKIEVVFCLDTTGSMGGLIDGAKALAARTGSPIFASDALIDAEGKVPEEETEGEDDEQLVEKFHDFIEGIRPEDFAS